MFAVNSIRSAEDAEGVLRETGVDMVDIGRGVLVNYDWAKDAAAGRGYRALPGLQSLPVADQSGQMPGADSP